MNQTKFWLVFYIKKWCRETILLKCIIRCGEILPQPNCLFGHFLKLWAPRLLLLIKKNSAIYLYTHKPSVAHIALGPSPLLMWRIQTTCVSSWYKRRNQEKQRWESHERCRERCDPHVCSIRSLWLLWQIFKVGVGLCYLLDYWGGGILFHIFPHWTIAYILTACTDDSGWLCSRQVWASSRSGDQKAASPPASSAMV